MLVLTYDIDRVWELLDEVETGLPWKARFPGSPTYSKIFQFLEEHGLAELNPVLYHHLKAQIDFNSRYQWDNYEKLR